MANALNIRPIGRGVRKDILTAAQKRNLFLAPKVIEIFESNGYSLEFVNTILEALKDNTMFVTEQDVMDFLNGDKNLFESEKTVRPHVPRHFDIEVLKNSDISGNSTCTGNIQDFIVYFRSRFHQLQAILKNRPDFGSDIVSIENAKGTYRDCNIVGMVYEVKTTKNGHRIITIEDEKSTIGVYIGKDSPLKDELFVTDEVVGFRGSTTKSGDLFIAKEVYRPDIPANHRWQKTDSGSSIAFLSDIHIGSKEFLKADWERMIRWMKTYSEEKQVNYLIMPGDVVDGIGAYPGQEDDLEILDIYEQYKALSETVKELPDDIKIIMHPGNHDACRLAEPQPALAEIYTKTFDSNVIMTGNPINVKVEGRMVTSYHGKSIDDWIAGVRGMSYEDPLAVMKEMAKRRHLAPMYGARNALAPEKRDYLAMDVVPDVFVSGHVHGAGYMEYRGVKMINASTWQSQTDYQAKHNFNPDPSIMPLVHLGTGRVTLKDFRKEV